MCYNGTINPGNTTKYVLETANLLMTVGCDMIRIRCLRIIYLRGYGIVGPETTCVKKLRKINCIRI